MRKLRRQMRLYPIVRLTCVKETLHTEEYKRFNTQRANELQGINKQIRETITRKVNSVDELKTQSASLIAKIKKLNNDDLINELETDYNVLCKQIKQTEQEISELNGQIAENDAEIKRNVEQKDFSKMEQSALYKEKLQKAVYHSLSAMRGILEIVFKNGMTRYVLIKKHRNGGTYLCPIRSKATWSVNKLSFRPYEPTRIIPIQPSR